MHLLPSLVLLCFALWITFPLPGDGPALELLRALAAGLGRAGRLHSRVGHPGHAAAVPDLQHHRGGGPRALEQGRAVPRHGARGRRKAVGCARPRAAVVRERAHVARAQRGLERGAARHPGHRQQ